MNYEKGQSLVELIIAMAIFGIAVGGIAIFILDNYASGRLSQEITTANFLAEEGLEATKSIRDNKWLDLSSGNHGLALSGPGGPWIFQGESEDVSSQFGKNATRVITIENIGLGQKKVSSIINWQFSEGRPQEVILVTYLTNWSRSGPYLAQLHYRWRNDDGGE